MTQSPALWRISTQWSLVNDPGHFVLRYADAIRGYLLHCLRDPHAADDAVQQILTHATAQGFAHAHPSRGRFRDYLIAIVRNAARRTQTRADRAVPLTDDIADLREDRHEKAWLLEWRTCLIDRAFRALHAHEIQTPGNLYYSVLRLVSDHPKADQAALGRELNARRGATLTDVAFRKTLSRARRMFATLLVREVARTLDLPSADDVEEELLSLELLASVTPYLPAEWKTDLGLISVS